MFLCFRNFINGTRFVGLLQGSTFVTSRAEHYLSGAQPFMLQMSQRIDVFANRETIWVSIRREGGYQGYGRCIRPKQ